MCPRQLAGWPSAAASSFHKWTTKESKLDSSLESFGYSGGFSGKSAPSMTTNTLHYYAGHVYLACLLVRLFDVSISKGKNDCPDHLGSSLTLSGGSIGLICQHAFQCSDFLLNLAIHSLQCRRKLFKMLQDILECWSDFIHRGTRLFPRKGG
jgi:hypothetical protein